MKLNKIRWFCHFSIFLLFLLLSCGPPRKILYRENFENKVFEISVDSFKHKKQSYIVLNGLIKDSSGKYLANYHISSICGCVSKYVSPKEQYKLATQSPYDISLTEEDKFVFKKFADFATIGNYCSKSLLDSAKGFTRIPRK